MQPKNFMSVKRIVFCVGSDVPKSQFGTKEAKCLLIGCTVRFLTTVAIVTQLVIMPSLNVGSLQWSRVRQHCAFIAECMKACLEVIRKSLYKNSFFLLKSHVSLFILARAHLTAVWTFILYEQERWSSLYSSKLLFMICIAIKGKDVYYISFYVKACRISVMGAVSGVSTPWFYYFDFAASLSSVCCFSSNILSTTICFSSAFP